MNYTINYFLDNEILKNIYMHLGDFYKVPKFHPIAEILK